MAFETAAGASIAFSATAPATFDEEGYDELDFDVAAEVTNIGEFGRQYALVTHLPLATRGVQKAKGSYNNGTISPTMAFDADDDGQAVIMDAIDSDDPIACRVTLQSGHTFYFMAMVMSARVSVPDADNIVMLTPEMEITGESIVEVDAEDEEEAPE